MCKLFYKIFFAELVAGIEQVGSQTVTARSTAYAHIYAPGKQRFQHPEILCHLQRTMIGQHYAAGQTIPAGSIEPYAYSVNDTAHDDTEAGFVHGDMLVRTWQFPSFRRAMEFVNQVAGARWSNWQYRLVAA